MVYYAEERKLHIGVYERVYLTELEHKLLICLSNNELVTHNEIKKYLNIKYRPSKLIYQLIEKSNYELHIENVHGRGYYLKDELYFK